MSEFEKLLTDCLENYQGKASEYQLLTFIEEQYPSFFDHLPNKSRLYQRHFWLFHSLYKLKQHWYKLNRHLEISALEISFSLANNGQQNIGEHDPLAGFYLDESNLHLSESEIAEMQKKFWQRYLALNEKADAIRLLELTNKTPLTVKVIKRSFQRLASIHHPDKGGSPEKFSQIQEAYQDLLVLFK